MPEPGSGPGPNPPEPLAEVERLNKMVRALMDRAERSTTMQGSEYSSFQATIVLEEQVRRRTAELEAALHENEKVNRELRESEEKFRGLVSQSLVGIVLIEEGRFSYTNAKFDEIFGYTAEEVREIPLLDLVVESDRALVTERLRQQISGEVSRIDYVFRGLRKNGEQVDIECHASRMSADARVLIISLILDITERARAENELRELQELLREQSTHDSLTGLYNRRFLEEAFNRELVLAERLGHPVSVILGDLDYFKTVNDAYGHLAGDEVLRVVAQLLRGQSRGSDICCRFGGEEFLLVLPGLNQIRAVKRAEQLRNAIASQRIIYGESLISVTASFGIATFPSNGRTSDALIDAADAALYSAKADGRNRVAVSAGAAVEAAASTAESTE